jgi:small subunit ribosomal protein S18
MMDDPSSEQGAKPEAVTPSAPPASEAPAPARPAERPVGPSSGRSGGGGSHGGGSHGGGSHGGPHSGGGSRGPRREGGGPGGGGPGGGGPGGGGPRRGKRQYFRKKKVCRFCVERIDFIDYKKAEMLQPFVQERGKIMPRRITGTCSRHQRWLGEAIKRARNIALLPFATEL